MNKRILRVLGLLVFVGMVYTAANTSKVVCTEYTVKSNKVERPYKVVFMSDLHYGCVQDKRVIDDALKSVSEECPDLIILGGDIVQSPVTSKSDMQRIFELLGALHTTDGIYFVYGNHDASDDGTAFDTHKHCDFYTQEDLLEALKENGIDVLCDSSIALSDNIVLIGRDNSMRLNQDRKSITSLVGTRTKYNMCVDHTPVELDECSKAGIDMLLSGHTHGGQLFPINMLESVVWHMPVYGERTHGHMTSIVSSGMGVGAYNLRNMHHCEYVVVNIVPK